MTRVRRSNVSESIPVSVGPPVCCGHTVSGHHAQVSDMLRSGKEMGAGERPDLTLTSSIPPVGLVDDSGPVEGDDCEAGVADGDADDGCIPFGIAALNGTSVSSRQVARP